MLLVALAPLATELPLVEFCLCTAGDAFVNASAGRGLRLPEQNPYPNIQPYFDLQPMGPPERLAAGETCDSGRCQEVCAAQYNVGPPFDRRGVIYARGCTATFGPTDVSVCECGFEDRLAYIPYIRGQPDSSGRVSNVDARACQFGDPSGNPRELLGGCSLAACNDYFGVSATSLPGGATCKAITSFMTPPPASPPTSPGDGGCGGGCIGGIVGGCFVPVLMCILWLSGAFAKFGCASPCAPKAKSDGVTMSNINPPA